MKFTGLEDSFPLVMERLLKRKILLVAGGAFNITENKPCPYARVAYARAPSEDMEKVCTFTYISARKRRKSVNQDPLRDRRR